MIPMLLFYFESWFYYGTQFNHFLLSGVQYNKILNLWLNSDVSLIHMQACFNIFTF